MPIWRENVSSLVPYASDTCSNYSNDCNLGQWAGSPAIIVKRDNQMTIHDQVALIW